MKELEIFKKIASSFNNTGTINLVEQKQLSTLATKYPYFSLVQQLAFKVDRETVSTKMIATVNDFEKLLGLKKESEMKHKHEPYNERKFDFDYVVNAVDASIQKEVGVSLEKGETSNKEENLHAFEEWVEIYEHSKKKLVEENIISKFISKKPQIKPRKSKFFSAENRAKESTTQNYALVTETLAKIYISQENYSESIRIYEALMEKNPEKSSYFAKKINNIKKSLKK